MNDRTAVGWRAVLGQGRRSRFAHEAVTLCAMGCFAATVSLGLLAGCGGASKDASSPGNCPDGTVLKGSDCVPAESAGSAGSPGKGSDDSTPSSSSAGSGSASSGSGSSSSSSSDSASTGAPASGGSSYDKAYVEGQLKSAARQVKSNCGSATDDNGTAPGPWGKTQASVTLGRNGHVQAVSVPAPYDGQPDGLCAVNAFKKLQFPPYAGSSDAVVPWDIEFMKPKK